MASALDLLASPQATEAQLKACDRAIERAEQSQSPWALKPRPSQARKDPTRLARIINKVLLVPRFAVAPMSAATIHQIQLRMPSASRAAIIKAIQRRRARQVTS
jgi:hypothetical protein